MRAGLHCGHGGVLADAAGDDDERDVELRFLQHLERPWRTKVGQSCSRQVSPPIALGQGRFAFRPLFPPARTPARTPPPAAARPACARRTPSPPPPARAMQASRRWGGGLGRRLAHNPLRLAKLNRRATFAKPCLQHGVFWLTTLGQADSNTAERHASIS